MITENDIAEWNKLRGQGMESAVGEYTPAAFWDALDEIELLRAAIRELVTLKEMKDRELGYDDRIEYLNRKPKAWAVAKALLPLN